MLRNSFYNLSGQTIRGGVALLTIPLLVRFMGLREYGVWSLAYAVLALMLTTEAGISVAAAVFLSRDLAAQDFDEACWTLTFVVASGILISFAAGMILWFSGILVAHSLSAFSVADQREVVDALKIAGLAVSAFILQRVLIGLEQAFDRYGTINALDVVQSLLANIGLIIVAWMGGNSVSMMKWQVFSWCCCLVVHIYFVFRLVGRAGLKFRWNAAKSARLLRFTAATWTSTLGSAAFGQCDRLIVGATLGAPVLGIYSAITNITSRINSFSGMAVQPLVPAINRDAQKALPISNRVREAAHLNVLIAAGAGVFVCVLSDWFISVMIPGANTQQNIFGLQIAALVYALYSVNAPGYFILFSVGEEWRNAIVTLLSAALSLALIYAGARYWGLVGALAGNVGYLGTLLMIVLGVKKIGISLRRYTAWVTLPIVALMVAFVFALTVQGHFWWRVIFVGVQAAVLATWFAHEQNGIARLRGSFARLANG